MSEIRFKLASNKLPKLDCPYCGAKKHWQRYVDTHTKEALPDRYGKCDNAGKCGEWFCPYKDGYHRDVYREESRSNSWKVVREPYREPKKQPKVNVPKNLLVESLTRYEQNQFVKFLKTLYPVDVVSQLISTYLIGTSERWDGATVFWFVNSEGSIRGGQIKHFDSNGHTRKDIKPDGSTRSRTTWVHSCEGYKYKQAGKVEPSWIQAYDDQDKKVDCLYGEQILQADLLKPVALFESPKSAIIAAPYFSEYICVATGGLTYFTKDRVQALKGRNVVVYPDLSKNGIAFADWKQRAKSFTDVNFRVSTMLEDDQTITAKQRADGYDMADYIVDRLNTWKADIVPFAPGIHTLTNREGKTFEVEINQDGYPASFDV